MNSKYILLGVSVLIALLDSGSVPRVSAKNQGHLDNEDLITLEYGVRANAQGEFSFEAYRGGALRRRS